MVAKVTVAVTTVLPLRLVETACSTSWNWNASESIACATVSAASSARIAFGFAVRPAAVPRQARRHDDEGDAAAAHPLLGLVVHRARVLGERPALALHERFTRV